MTVKIEVLQILLCDGKCYLSHRNDTGELKQCILPLDNDLNELLSELKMYVNGSKTIYRRQVKGQLRQDFYENVDAALNAAFADLDMRTAFPQCVFDEQRYLGMEEILCLWRQRRDAKK
jgi:hypothetical protein